MKFLMVRDVNDKFPVWLTEMQIKSINMCIDASLKIAKQAGMEDDEIFEKLRKLQAHLEKSKELGIKNLKQDFKKVKNNSK